MASVPLPAKSSTNHIRRKADPPQAGNNSPPRVGLQGRPHPRRWAKTKPARKGRVSMARRYPAPVQSFRTGCRRQLFFAKQGKGERAEASGIRGCGRAFDQRQRRQKADAGVARRTGGVEGWLQGCPVVTGHPCSASQTPLLEEGHRKACGTQNRCVPPPASPSRVRRDFGRGAEQDEIMYSNTFCVQEYGWYSKSIF